VTRAPTFAVPSGYFFAAHGLDLSDSKLVILFVLLSVIRCANKYGYMELRQIRSFLSIAETPYFGCTADLIHLSQPALSLQIRALEEEVGIRLFERNRRNTTLTAAGFAFRDDAAAALSQLDQAIRRARLAADGKLGPLRIGFISTAGSEIVPHIFRQFRELNPEVEFSLRAIPTAGQVQMLETGSLDIGFLRLPIGGQPSMLSQCIANRSYSWYSRPINWQKEKRCA
jgi:DNA-binding transcriptional LysR family regulator